MMKSAEQNFEEKLLEFGRLKGYADPESMGSLLADYYREQSLRESEQGSFGNALRLISWACECIAD